MHLSPFYERNTTVTSTSAVTTDTSVDQQQAEGKKYKLSREARARFRSTLPPSFRASDAPQYLDRLESDSEKLDFYYYLMVERKIGPDEIGSDLTAAVRDISPEHVALCTARLARRLKNTRG